MSKINNIPIVHIGDFITIGKNNIKAVIARIITKDKIEIVYYQNEMKYIYEYVIWNGKFWKFDSLGVGGGYAENQPRLKPFLNILKEGPKYY